MGKLLRKLKALLRREFPRSTMELRITVPRYRVGGLFIWDGFVGMAQIDRQVELRRAIDRALPPDDQLEVSFILTVTPDEFASITKRN